MKKLIASCALVLGLLIGAAPTGAAPILTFTSSDPNIAVGESVTIDATISGLGAEILAAYDLNFTYNPALLLWQSITQFIAPFNVNFSSITGFDNVVNGDLGLFLSSLDSDADLIANQPDSILLFRFTLQGLADGATLFTLGPDPTSDREFLGLNRGPLDVAVGSICIQVGRGSACPQQVPEPASSTLAAVALLAALAPAALRRRRGKAMV